MTKKLDFIPGGDSAGMKLASRFTLPPNSLGYCGRGSAPERFKKCFIHGDCDHIEKEISKFIVLYPYLKTISSFSKLPVLSQKVVESYWIGNKQLNRASQDDYDTLIKNFTKQGVPDWLVDELKHKKPNKFIPTHLFQILHVGVGRASGAVPFNLDSINNCMIRWGKVTDIFIKGTSEINKKYFLTAELNSLKKNKKFILTIKKQTFEFVPDFLPKLKIGDFVSVHWKLPIKILNSRETSKLEFWTRKVLEYF